MPRGKMLLTFEAAAHSGPYDEYPVLSAGVDPQLHLSRNDQPQPFYLTCEKDSLIVQMSGLARVKFKESTVRSFKLVPGDYVYVPGGTPHRIEPIETSVQYRYKAENAGCEAVTFCCEACGGELYTSTWDTAEELPQAAYSRTTRRFNSETALRECDKCGHVSPVIDVTAFRWDQIAEELENSVEEEAAW